MDDWHGVTRYLAFLAFGAALALGTGSATAQQQGSGGGDASQTATAEVREQHGPFDLSYKYMTGDWGGVRTDLEDWGLTVKISLMNQLMANLHGGIETKNGHDTAGSYEVNFYFDMEKLLDIRDATFWIRGKGTWGGDDSDFDKEKIGGLFKTNQDAGSEEPIFVDKWHWQQFFFDKKVELRIGRQEPVKDLFDTSKIIGHEDKYFLNQALVRNATIPSTKGLGVFAKWKFTDHAYVSTAALDANAKDRQTNFNTAFHGPDEFRFFAELVARPSSTRRVASSPDITGSAPGMTRHGRRSSATPSAGCGRSSSRAETGASSSVSTRWSGRRTTTRSASRGSRSPGVTVTPTARCARSRTSGPLPCNTRA